MIVYRITKKEYARDLSGKGAEISGGRWNSKGTRMVYTSESRALAMAEVAVHLSFGILPKNYQIVQIKIPEEIKVIDLKQSELPTGWNTIPPIHQTQEAGDYFIQKKEYAVMKVPSAVVPGDFNYLINPNHPESVEIKIKKTEDFIFDPRLK